MDERLVGTQDGDEPQTRVSQSEILRATGSDFCYSYVELPRQANIAMISNYCADTRALLAPIAKEFDTGANSRWVLRHYLAIKFATAANLLGGSAAYAHAHNLMLGVPYFTYYAVLNACRAYLLTSPKAAWEGEKTVKMTHSNILARTADHMRALDSSRYASWRDQLESLREHRNLFSYRFPLSGPGFVSSAAFDVDAAIAFARLIAELASLNSECLDGALRKHTSSELEVEPLSDHDWARAYDLAGVSTVDPNDHYRFGKLTSWRTVAPLEIMASDGLMDDIYGTWSDPDGRPGVFDPDGASGLILAL